MLDLLTLPAFLEAGAAILADYETETKEAREKAEKRLAELLAGRVAAPVVEPIAPGLHSCERCGRVGPRCAGGDPCANCQQANVAAASAAGLVVRRDKNEPPPAPVVGLQPVEPDEFADFDAAVARGKRKYPTKGFELHRRGQEVWYRVVRLDGLVEKGWVDVAAFTFNGGVWKQKDLTV